MHQTLGSKCLILSLNCCGTDCKVTFQQSLSTLDSVFRLMPKTLRFCILTSMFCDSPVSGHSRPLHTSLGENYLFAPETASASSEACFPFHTEGKSHPKSFQHTKNTSCTLLIHLLHISTHQRAENSPHDLGNMLFSAWPTALCLQLDGSLETCGILC